MIAKYLREGIVEKAILENNIADLVIERMKDGRTKL